MNLSSAPQFLWVFLPLETKCCGEMDTMEPCLVWAATHLRIVLTNANESHQMSTLDFFDENSSS